MVVIMDLGAGLRYSSMTYNTTDRSSREVFLGTDWLRPLKTMKHLPPPGGRAYLRPGPTPKMPPGLEELMEGMTREVLRNNPPDIYGFCTKHMQKLLQIRDTHLKTSRAITKPTLEDKIKKAQIKINERALERVQLIDKDLDEKESLGNIGPINIPKDDDVVPQFKDMLVNSVANINKNEIYSETIKDDKELESNDEIPEPIVQNLLTKNSNELESNDIKKEAEATTTFNNEQENNVIKKDNQEHKNDENKDNSYPHYFENERIVDDVTNNANIDNMSEVGERDHVVEGQVIVLSKSDISIENENELKKEEDVCTIPSNIDSTDKHENVNTSLEKQIEFNIDDDNIKNIKNNSKNEENWCETSQNGVLAAKYEKKSMASENQKLFITNDDNNETNDIEEKSDTYKEENHSVKYVLSNNNINIGVITVNKNMLDENLTNETNDNTLLEVKKPDDINEKSNNAIEIKSEVDIVLDEKENHNNSLNHLLSESNSTCVISEEAKNKLVDNNVSMSNEPNDKVIDTEKLVNEPNNFKQTIHSNMPITSYLTEISEGVQIQKINEEVPEEKINIESMSFNAPNINDAAAKNSLETISDPCIQNNNLICAQIDDSIQIENNNGSGEVLKNEYLHDNMIEKNANSNEGNVLIQDDKIVKNSISPENDNHCIPDVIYVIDNKLKEEKTAHNQNMLNANEIIIDNINKTTQNIDETLEIEISLKDHINNVNNSIATMNLNNLSADKEESERNNTRNDVCSSDLQKNVDSEERNGTESNTFDSENKSSIEDSINDLNSGFIADNSLSDENPLKRQPSMDLETAAITIQKVFRSFMFKSRASTLDEIPNYEESIDIPYMPLESSIKNEIEINNEDFIAPNTDRRTLGLSRMDTVLQTVNEEKSLSLSTDDSSTLSSAATTIQAHVRGFLVRNRRNSNKTNSSSSMLTSDGLSMDTDNEGQKNKTVLNIHIVPEGGQFISRDDSIGTSADLSFDVSPRSSNLHPLGYDKSERRKQLKREDAIQSVSPPSNNSGKASEDVESVKEFSLNNNAAVPEIETTVQLVEKSEVKDIKNKGDSVETSPSKSITADTVIEVIKNENDKQLNTENKRERLTKMSSDESDVVTPYMNSDDTSLGSQSSRLLHSGEFHDIVLPTRVSRNEASVVREFQSAWVYFLRWNS